MDNRVKCLGILALLVGILAGIGFYPVSSSETYSCDKVESYSCFTDRDTFCGNSTVQVPCTDNESTPCNKTVAYIANGSQLSYSLSQHEKTIARESCAIITSVYLENTDTVGGDFTIVFKCTVDGTINVRSVRKYVDSGSNIKFSAEFPRGCEQKYHLWFLVVEPGDRYSLAHSVDSDTCYVYLNATCPESCDFTCCGRTIGTCNRTIPGTCTSNATHRLWW